MGYFVPETHIAYFRREQLAIDAGRAGRGEGRHAAHDDAKRTSTGILRHVKRDGRTGPCARWSAGACRASRSGPHKYHGTRTDDANDVVPHEDRRELRGLRVFSAWLNHDDSRSVNSLDMYVPPGYVKHHLIDFSSTLGSGSDATRQIAPAEPARAATST